MSGACGACTACCTLIRVEMQPPKPARETCIHCSADGCENYPNRPDPCRGFMCLWLASQDVTDRELPPVMRPDRSGVVLDLNSVGNVIAHCSHAAAWKREPTRTYLLDLAKRVHVFLELPDGAALLAADGSTDELVKIGVDPVTNNRLYARASEMAATAASAAA